MAMHNPNEVVSLLDDDDELQIVEETIRRPPLPPQAPPTAHHSFLVQDDEIEVVDPGPSATALAAIALQSTRDDPAQCAACADPLPPDHLVVSRCRHALCALCALRCVAKELPTSLGGCPIAGLKEVATCVVRRCGAPLKRPEIDAALVPPAADAHFAPCFARFREWRAEVSDTFFGPHCVIYPNFTASMAATALREAGEGEYIPGEDVSGAVAPLYLWDEVEEAADGTPGAWMCAACGEYARADAAQLAARRAQDDGSIPDHPTAPHCAVARAAAVAACIDKLKNVEVGIDAKPASRATRSSTRKGKGKIRRYQTARSITAKRRRTTNGFAKGTGYAGAAGSEWTGTSMKILEKTARLDAARAYWFSRIRTLLLPADGEEADKWPPFMRALLRECGLPPLLAQVLRNESIMDVGERVPVYVASLRVVAGLCDSPSLRRLVAEPADGGSVRSLASLVESLSTQSALLTTGVGHENLPEKTKILIKQVRRNIRAVNRYELLKEVSAPSGPGSGVPSKTSSSDAAGAAANGAEAAGANCKTTKEVMEEEYKAAMKPFQFQTVAGLAAASTFRNEINKGGPSSSGRGQNVRRMCSEVSSMYSSLPLSWSSSILLRVDEERYDFLRACIFGPEDSPYECGAYLFDIYLPPTYPDEPPKFKLLTTGGGRVRFNPNLYASGKVCLSLLGTWSGPRWTSASTLLQVLVSIQSLILVAEPFFNEPGLERRMGTPHGQRESESYNRRVRHNNFGVAILGTLVEPYNEFLPAFKTHFTLKRSAIEKTMFAWFGFRAPGYVPDAAAEAAHAEKEKARAKKGAPSNRLVHPLPPIPGLPNTVATTLATAATGSGGGGNGAANGSGPSSTAMGMTWQTSPIPDLLSMPVGLGMGTLSGGGMLTSFMEGGPLAAGRGDGPEKKLNHEICQKILVRLDAIKAEREGASANSSEDLI